MIIRKAFKVLKLIKYYFLLRINIVITKLLFFLNGVSHNGKFKTNGIPLVNINLSGKMTFGKNFYMNNGGIYNLIGRQQKNIFIVGRNAELKIGNNVGISACAIICHKEIVIGDNVLIGGNTVIYDTDFHSLDYNLRRNSGENPDFTLKSTVVIEDNVFIGAHVTILKGVIIGKNSIVAACSVVTKNIPRNEIWGGNPARFIRKIN